MVGLALPARAGSSPRPVATAEEGCADPLRLGFSRLRGNSLGGVGSGFWGRGLEGVDMDREPRLASFRPRGLPDRLGVLSSFSILWANPSNTLGRAGEPDREPSALAWSGPAFEAARTDGGSASKASAFWKASRRCIRSSSNRGIVRRNELAWPDRDSRIDMMRGSAEGCHLGRLRQRVTATSSSRSFILVGSTSSWGDSGGSLMSSSNWYFVGCRRSHPSTLIKPHTAISRMVSVIDRLISTGLVKNDSSKSSTLFNNGSCGFNVWGGTSCGAPGRLSGIAGSLWLLVDTLGVTSLIEQGWPSTRVIVSFRIES